MCLWRLRERDRSVYVWIDAICIYQRMKCEKDQQVPIMDKIYSTTEETIVYLGEEEDNSDLVMDFAKDVSRKLLVLEDRQPKVQIHRENLARFGLPPVADPGWKALRDLFKREWFQRKWIIQECSLAKRISCILGDYKFDFELLRITHRLCLQHGLDRLSTDGGFQLTIPYEHPLTVLSIIKDLIRQNFDQDPNAKAKTLPWLLGATSYAQVSKFPHDHIYALLGLHQVSASIIGLPLPLVQYDRPAEEVFIDYACIDDWKADDVEVSLLELASNVDALATMRAFMRTRSQLAGSQPTTLKLPSWVPDWTVTTSLKYILSPSPSSRYGATAAKDRSDFTFDRAGRKLVVRTAMLDCITSTPPTRLDFRDDTVSGPWANEYRSMQRMGFEYLKALSKQCPFVTSKGYHVLAHQFSRDGDRIVIILGERVPFVIRQVGSKYKLIGGAFFSSIMQGEGLDPRSSYYIGNTLCKV